MKTQSLGFGESVKKLAAEAGLQPYRFTQVDEKNKRDTKFIKIFLKVMFYYVIKNLLEKIKKIYSLKLS